MKDAFRTANGRFSPPFVSDSGSFPEAVRVPVAPAPLGHEARPAGGAALRAHAVQVAAKRIIGRDAKAAVLHRLPERGRDIEPPGACHHKQFRLKILVVGP